MNVDELRDLLRERADGGDAGNPARYDQVRGRVRRLLRRRLAGAGAGAAAAVALMLIGVSAFVSGGQRSQDVAAVPTPPAGMPERFTEDGIEYRLLGTTTLSQPREDKAEVIVPVTGKPIAVAIRCEGRRLASQPPDIFINDEPGSAGAHLCVKERDLVQLPVPRTAKRIKIRFQTPGLDGAQALECRAEMQNGTPGPMRDCVTPPPPTKADWTFGVYEWTPPATARKAETPPMPPKVLRDGDVSLHRRVAAERGVWPQDDEVTLTAPYRGKQLGVEFVCTGSLATRLYFEISVNGDVLSNGIGNCGTWTKGEEFPLSMVEFDPPEGDRKATVKIKWSLGGPMSQLPAKDFENRPVGWSAGVYEQIKDED